MSAGNLKLLARVQVAWGCPIPLAQQCSINSSSYDTNRVQVACTNTFSMRHIQMYKDRSMS